MELAGTTLTTQHNISTGSLVQWSSMALRTRNLTRTWVSLWFKIVRLHCFCTVLGPLVDVVQTSIDRISACLRMVSYAPMRFEMAMKLNSFRNEQQYYSPGAIRRQYIDQRANAFQLQLSGSR